MSGRMRISDVPDLKAWDSQAEALGVFVPAPAMTYTELVATIRGHGFMVQPLFDPRGQGYVRLAVRGSCNGIPFATDTCLQLLPNTDFRPYLETFYAALGMGIEPIFSGRG